jgi:putative spermidine/putrescine transport system substrate-binding protein
MKKTKKDGKKENEVKEPTLLNTKVNRREFIKKSAKMGIGASGVIGSLVGGGSLLKASPARAAKSIKGSGKIVVCGWGGGFQDAMRDTIFKPFEKESGIKVIDTGTPSMAKVKAQVDSGNIEWDIALVSYQETVIIGHNYFEELDYSYFDKEDLNAIPEGAKKKVCCAAYFFSYVMAYNKKKYPNGTHPKSYAEFVDFQRFPGKRTFPGIAGGGHVHVEEAQMGMGVPRNQLYPPDLKKVWAFYDKLKPHCVKWWDNGAAAPQLLVDKEVDLACAYNGRIQQLIDQGLPFDIEWNQGTMSENSYAVLKGAKNAENAMKFVGFAMRPEIQAALAERYPYGPSNPRAAELVKPETKTKLNTTPEKFKKQVLIDWDWYCAQTLDQTKRFSNLDYLNKEWQSWSMI